jgi:hypothetical protein
MNCLSKRWNVKWPSARSNDEVDEAFPDDKLHSFTRTSVRKGTDRYNVSYVCEFRGTKVLTMSVELGDYFGALSKKLIFFCHTVGTRRTFTILKTWS